MTPASHVVITKKGRDMVCHFQLGPKTTEINLLGRVMNAYQEGFRFFSFEFAWKGRQFRDRLALEADATEQDAQHMAQEQWARFLKTVEQLIR